MQLLKKIWKDWQWAIALVALLYGIFLFYYNSTTSTPTRIKNCEERIAMREMIEHKSADLLERLERFCAAASGLTLMEMGEVADMLKDLSEVEKNLAKAHHYENECPRYEEKKY